MEKAVPYKIAPPTISLCRESGAMKIHLIMIH